MDKSPIHVSIDLHQPGKQHGHLYVPYSYNLAGWANLMLPLTVINNGPGPQVLLLAGNHGDEYPGQIAILKLCRELGIQDIQGRLILVPILNLPASKASTRLSPLDGKNLNRCFPGKADGAVTEIIAHFLTTVLFPQVDAVIDIHTGGRGVDFVPCSTMHLVSDLEQRRKMIAAAEAWGTEFSFMYADIAGTGLLPVEAENQGKIVVTTEMGGSELVPASIHRITQDGLRNVLVHLGVVRGEVAKRARPTRWLQALQREDYLFAPESGLFEQTVMLGSEVAAGALLGQIHFVEQPQRPPLPIAAAAAGVVLALRAPALTTQGDCVAVVAHDVEASVL